MATRELVVDSAVEHENTQGEVKSWKVQVGEKKAFLPMSTCNLTCVEPLTFEVPVFLHKRIMAAA